MNKAKLRANQIFNAYNLREEDEEVKRNLMVLLLTVSDRHDKPRSYVEAFKSLSGAWENNGMLAEDEVDAIYEARRSGQTRKMIDL